MNSIYNKVLKLSKAKLKLFNELKKQPAGERAETWNKLNKLQQKQIALLSAVGGS